jgi:hypothetical protein
MSLHGFGEDETRRIARAVRSYERLVTPLAPPSGPAIHDGGDRILRVTDLTPVDEDDYPDLFPALLMTSTGGSSTWNAGAECYYQKLNSLDIIDTERRFHVRRLSVYEPDGKIIYAAAREWPASHDAPGLVDLTDGQHLGHGAKEFDKVYVVDLDAAQTLHSPLPTNVIFATATDAHAFLGGHLYLKSPTASTTAGGPELAWLRGGDTATPGIKIFCDVGVSGGSFRVQNYAAAGTLRSYLLYDFNNNGLVHPIKPGGNTGYACTFGGGTFTGLQGTILDGAEAVGGIVTNLGSGGTGLTGSIP